MFIFVRNAFNDAARALRGDLLAFSAFLSLRSFLDFFFSFFAFFARLRFFSEESLELEDDEDLARFLEESVLEAPGIPHASGSSSSLSPPRPLCLCQAALSARLCSIAATRKVFSFSTSLRVLCHSARDAWLADVAGTLFAQFVRAFAMVTASNACMLLR